MTLEDIIFITSSIWEQAFQTLSPIGTSRVRTEIVNYKAVRRSSFLGLADESVLSYNRIGSMRNAQTHQPNDNYETLFSTIISRLLLAQRFTWKPHSHIDRFQLSVLSHQKLEATKGFPLKLNGVATSAWKCGTFGGAFASGLPDTTRRKVSRNGNLREHNTIGRWRGIGFKWKNLISW